jgi:hypothetical protein
MRISLPERIRNVCPCRVFVKNLDIFFTGVKCMTLVPWVSSLGRAPNLCFIPPTVQHGIYVLKSLVLSIPTTLCSVSFNSEPSELKD